MKISVLFAASLLTASLLTAAASPALADDVGALIARSHAAEAHGQTQSALMLMQAAVVADPARASTYVALGDLYLRNHAAAEAHKYFDEALNIDPKNTAAHKGLAGIERNEKTATAKTDLLDKN